MDSLQKTQSTAGSDPKESFVLRLTLLITAATYLSTLRFNFVYEDIQLILQNPFVKSWRYVSQYFSGAMGNVAYPSSAGDSYCPLFFVWIRMLYSVFRARPFGWHLAALLLYVITAWLVYRVVKQMTGQAAVAWLTALIFGLHPIHHEVVAWISGMKESLATILFLAAFLAYLRSRTSATWAWRVVSCALYGAALLCNERTIVLPALVFVCDWLEIEDPSDSKGSGFTVRIRKATISIFLYIPIALIYLVARSRILAGAGHPYSRVNFSIWLKTLPSILIAYVTHWFYPVRLAEFYDVSYQPKFDFWHVALPAVILIAMGAVMWIFRKKLDEKHAGFAAAWLVMPLLPALDKFVLRPQELVQDRYFFMPSIGAAFLTALVIVRAAKTRIGPFGMPRHVGASGLGISVVLVLLATQAVSFWADDFTLFSRGHEIAPFNSTAAINLGAELLAQGKVDAAQELLEAVYQRHGDDAGLAISLGRIQYLKKQYAASEAYARRAISLDPTIPDAYFNLGQIELKENLRKGAQESMHRAVELNPYSARFHISYGIALQVNGDCAGANQQFEVAQALDPSEAIAKQLETVHCRAEAAPSQPPAAKPGQF